MSFDINKIFPYLVALPLVFPGQVLAKQKQNVVFIAIDDLNDWVGCLDGNEQAKTPNIDRLASAGLLFTNAHCQAPISGPSRASVMTGLYPSSTGNYFQMRDENIKRSNDITTKAIFLPDYFEKHGYKTMAVGKIYHNGDGANTFQQYGGVFDKFGPTPELRVKYDPAWFADKFGKTQTDWGAFPEHDSLMPDYKYAEWAVSKLYESHEKPFFLAVGFVRPHVPWHVPQKWFDMFPPEQIKYPPYDPNDFDDIPEMAKKVTEVPAMPTTEWLIATNQWKDVVRAYLASVAFVDAQVGKILDALENSEYARNTIVVLWSDHGYHLGEKNRVAKQALWERNTRIPLIFKGPDIIKGSKTNAPVQLIDMYPTLTELCELPAYELAEGKSLVPLITNPKLKWPYPAISIYGEGNIAVRNHRYRLIQYEDKSYELYDLKVDPNEFYNLAGKRKYGHLVTKLRKSIPVEWAPNSKYSTNNINSYFINKHAQP